MPKAIKLFVELAVGEMFHFYDKVSRKLIKIDSEHYVSPGGIVRRISKTVGIFRDSDDRPKGDPYEKR